jgi:uncharacterized protein YebE (UPF0316 family)
VLSFPIASIFHTGPVLPLLVFLAETCVLTLATLRTICIARGKKAPAALLGFFEVSIWLFAIGQVMQNLTSPDCYLAFAAGFTLGNYLGILIEQTLALGNLTVQITSRTDAGALIQGLRSAGYGVTKLEGHGATGPVDVVITVVQRKDLSNVASIIERFAPQAFYSVHDLKTATEGIFPNRFTTGAVPGLLLSRFRMIEPGNNRNAGKAEKGHPCQASDPAPCSAVFQTDQANGMAKSRHDWKTNKHT